MKKQVNLTLPEWAFLEATSHLGNTLEGRTILQHIRSYTMMEIFDTDSETVQINPEVKQRAFTHENFGLITENLLIVVHFSLAEYAELDDIIDKAIDFYCKYSDWEDNSIITEHTSKHN